jgi:NhaP-type Na+/H+ or K+/H+ antiporter
MIESPGFTASDFGRWFLIEFLARSAAGVAIGAAIGLGLVFLNRKLPQRLRLPESREGLAVIGIMFFVYGCSELASANGLVAVFAAGLSIRQTTQALEYTKASYAFAEQLERLLLTVILLLFGGNILHTPLPSLLSMEFLFIVLALFTIRPLATFFAFWGAPESWRERTALGYFGIRGIGTLYYLFYTMSRGSAEDTRLAPMITLAVLISIGVYGLTGVAGMRMLDRKHFS